MDAINKQRINKEGGGGGYFILFVTMCRVLVAVCATWCIAGVSATCPLPVGGENYFSVSATLTFMQGVACPELQALSAANPNVTMRSFKKKDIFSIISEYGRSLNEDVELLQHEAFETGHTPNDVYSVGGSWIPISIESFAPLGQAVAEGVMPVWQQKNRDGEVVNVPYVGSRLVMYYRRDLFEKHGYTWPETMAEFDVTVRAVMEAERRERGAGAADFWGLSMPADDSTNRLTYILILLLSAENAGSIVESDRSVTINNPAAAVVLERWRSWFGTISPLSSFGMSRSDAQSIFYNGNALVILDFTSRINLYSKLPFDAAIGATPGGGSGVFGGNNNVVPKTAPRKEMGVQYLQYFSKVLHQSSVEKDNTEPLLEKTVSDPKLFAEYCSNPLHRLMCDALPKYPDFWKRMAYRPSAGCGGLYADCLGHIYKRVRPFLESTTPATQTVQDLEKDLLELLGHARPETSHPDSGAKWKYMLVAVACVSALVLALLGVFVWRQNKRMRKADGCGIPISVCLGFVVLVFIGLLGGVLVEKSDSALREVSLDMSLEVRMQALSVMSTTLRLTLEGLDSPDLSSLGVIQTALVEVKNSFSRQRVLEGSIIVVVDVADGAVLVSSDLGRQPEQEANNVHPWVRDALTQLEFQTKLIDRTRTVRVTDDEGTVALCNQDQVSVGIREGFGRDRSWILMYITPEHVILGKATATREATLYIGVSLALAAVVCVVFCAVVVTNPLVHLAEDMEHVRTMNLERVSDTKRSLFTELGSLRAGFDSMRELLVYYKAFMPQSAFVDTDTDPDVHPDLDSMKTSSCESQRCSGSLDSSVSSHGSIRSYVSAGVAALSMGLKKKKVALLLTNLSGFDKHSDPSTLTLHTAMLEMLFQETRGHKGVVDSVSGDKVTVSFNAVTRAAQCEKSAVHMALAVSAQSAFAGGNVAASCGVVRAGNMGTQMMKGFALLGPLLSTLWRMERWGCTWEVPILISEALEASIVPFVNTKKVLRVRDGDIVKTLFGVTTAKQEAANDEWMYQLEEMQKNDPHNTYNVAFDALYDDNVRPAAEQDYSHLDMSSRSHLEKLIRRCAKDGEGCLKTASFHGIVAHSKTQMR